MPEAGSSSRSCSRRTTPPCPASPLTDSSQVPIWPVWIAPNTIGAWLLLPEITKPGDDISEHFLCKYELVNSPGFVAVLNDLYLSADGTGYKKGMQGNGKGTVKRLRIFTGQLELTYDLMSLTRERILELLPSEFDRFR